MQVNEATEESTLARIERTVLIGFYSIRRLQETYKVSQLTKSQPFELIYHNNIERVDYFNWHKIDKFFDIKSTNTETVDAIFLCNQFVHSYVFIVATDEHGEFSGCYVCSDKKRHKKLYFVTSQQIIGYFRIVGRDYPHTQSFTRRPVDEQWEETTNQIE